MLTLGDVVRDKNFEDVQIYFDDTAGRGGRAWQDSEVLAVDVAFSQLQSATQSPMLLRFKNGGELHFQRVDSLGTFGGGTLASNTQRLIRVADLTFTTPYITPDTTVAHEIGHNWDDENPNWDAFKQLSGWTQSDPKSSDYIQTTNEASPQTISRNALSSG